MDAVKKDLEELRTDIRKLNGDLKQIASARTDEARKKVEGYAKEHPLYAAGAILTTGFLAGLFLGSRR